MSTNNPPQNNSTNPTVIQSFVQLQHTPDCDGNHHHDHHRGHLFVGALVYHQPQDNTSTTTNKDDIQDTFALLPDEESHNMVDNGIISIRPEVVGAAPSLACSSSSSTMSTQHNVKKRSRGESSSFENNLSCKEVYQEGGVVLSQDELITPLERKHNSSSLFGSSRHRQTVKRIKPCCSPQKGDDDLSAFEKCFENQNFPFNGVATTNTTSSAPPTQIIVEKKKSSIIVEHSSFHLPGEIIETIFSFMDDSSRMVAERVSVDFHKACLQVEKRDLIRLWNIENSCLLKPLSEDTVSPILLSRAEREFNCVLPFHLKTFLVELSDGRPSWHNEFAHISNMLAPLSEWKDIGEYIRIGQTLSQSVVLLLCKKNGYILFKYSKSASVVNFKNWVQMKNRHFHHVHYNIGCILERKSSLPYSFHTFNDIPSCCNFKPIVKAIVSHRGTLFRYAKEELKNDEDVALCAIPNDPNAFHHCSDALKDNENVARAAVSKDGRLLQHISSRLKDNFEITKLAISQSPMSLQHASISLRNDPDLVYLAATTCFDAFENALQFAGSELKSSKHFMEKVLKIRGNCLKYASDTLKGDTDLVSIAVQQKGIAIQYASPLLKKDFGIIYSAVIQDARSVKYVPESLKSQRQFIFSIIELNPKALEFVPDHFRQDRDIVLKGKLFLQIQPFNRGTAVQRDGMTLYFASKPLRGDLQIVLAAISQNRKALQFATCEVQYLINQQQ